METLRWRGMAPSTAASDGVMVASSVVVRSARTAAACGDDQQKELGLVRGLQERKGAQKRGLGPPIPAKIDVGVDGRRHNGDGRVLHHVLEVVHDEGSLPVRGFDEKITEGDGILQ